jgi:hypothetical protein
MAKADPESALTFVALKDILTALEAIPGESPEGARRFVIRGCANEQIPWRAREPAEPPANFWRGTTTNFVFSPPSDVTNRAAVVIMPDGIPDLVAVTLRGVELDWKSVAALRPEIGPRPTSSTRAAPSNDRNLIQAEAARLMTPGCTLKALANAVARSWNKRPKVRRKQPDTVANIIRDTWRRLRDDPTNHE